MEQHVPFILASTLIFLLPLAAARNVIVPAMILLAFLLIAIPVHFGISMWTFISCAVVLVMLTVFLGIARKKRIFMLESSVELKRWRIIARPFALLFIPINIYLGHSFLLYLLGILSIIFILTDIYRLISRHRLSLFFKKSEVQRFSSMTSYIVAVFIVFLVFPEKVAYLCLAFITIGDTAGKFIGLKYGTRKLVHTRTLQGSLGFLTGCLFAGFIVMAIFDIRFSWLLAGALCATLAELFSFSLDDNFTVSILTGTCLVALQYFRVI